MLRNPFSIQSVIQFQITAVLICTVRVHYYYIITRTVKAEQQEMDKNTLVLHSSLIRKKHAYFEQPSLNYSNTSRYTTLSAS